MSAGTVIFLLLIAGSVVAMVAMHRGGGHSHGMGMGGCCGGGHGHGSTEDEKSPETAAEPKKPILGPPGTKSSTPTAAAGGHRHHGC